MNTQDSFLKTIKANIEKYGYHITIVIGESFPRYCYTIGLNQILGFELVFAGGSYFMKDELFTIINSIVERIRKLNKVNDFKMTIEGLGSFSTSTIDSSWSKLMLLGVFDYYKIDTIKAYQIKPDGKYFTLDIPNMSRKWNPNSEPVWKWIGQDWQYPVPENSTATTNIEVLKGKAVTEVMRWEDDEWEMFSMPGPEVKKEDVRIVPLSCVVGIDKSLLAVLDLEIGKGLWRDSSEDQWNEWS